MAKERVLVVEDDEDILELLKYNLTREGYRFTGVTSGEAALKAAAADLPDLILLDLMLPELDGLEVCRRLKLNPATAPIPLIMVTAKGEEADIVAGLELGADDYITKPFSPRVLLARVRSVLRRRRQAPSPKDAPLTMGGLTLHPGRHEVLVEGQPLDLTATEFRLLHLLVQKPGWVFTRGQIIRLVHGDDYPASDRSVDVQVVSLRKKLGPYGKFLETVRGVGYRWKE